MRALLSFGKLSFKSLRPSAIYCLWPGLPQLWHDGQWLGLGLALGFAAVANVALLATFIWSEWLPFWGVVVSWLATVACYVGGVTLAVKQGYGLAEPVAESEPDAFPEARIEYLRGNWYQAEALCRRLLDRNDHDAESHLLMVGVLRRTNRYREARRQLTLLASLETAEPWRHEIENELLRIDEQKSAAGAHRPARKLTE